MGEVLTDLPGSATKVEDRLWSGDPFGYRIEDFAIYRERQQVIGKSFCIVLRGDVIGSTYRRRIEGFHDEKSGSL